MTPLAAARPPVRLAPRRLQGRGGAPREHQAGPREHLQPRPLHPGRRAAPGRAIPMANPAKRRRMQLAAGGRRAVARRPRVARARPQHCSSTPAHTHTHTDLGLVGREAGAWNGAALLRAALQCSAGDDLRAPRPYTSRCHQGSQHSSLLRCAAAAACSTQGTPTQEPSRPAHLRTEAGPWRRRSGRGLRRRPAAARRSALAAASPPPPACATRQSGGFPGACTTHPWSHTAPHCCPIPPDHAHHI